VFQGISVWFSNWNDWEEESITLYHSPFIRNFEPLTHRTSFIISLFIVVRTGFEPARGSYVYFNYNATYPLCLTIQCVYHSAT
jgi:hypothetical protein